MTRAIRNSALVLLCLTPFVFSKFLHAQDKRKSRNGGTPCTSPFGANPTYNSFPGTPDTADAPTIFTVCLPPAPTGTQVFVIEYVSVDMSSTQNLAPAAVFHMNVNGIKIPLLAAPGFNSRWVVFQQVHIGCTPSMTVTLDLRQYGSTTPPGANANSSFSIVGHYE